MAVVFTISTTQVLERAGLDTADSTNIADANRYIGNGKFQEAMEQKLNPAALVTTQYDVHQGLILLCAAEVVAARQRQDPSSMASFQVAGFGNIGKVEDLSVALRAEANRFLARWMLRGAVVDSVGTSASPVSEGAQDAMFGPSESARIVGED